MQDKNNKIDRIISVLESSSDRFSNYQSFPEIVLKTIPKLKEIKYKKGQIDLDQKRYNWLNKYLERNIKTALDIGANLGYFSIMLASRNNLVVDAYEPYLHYNSVLNELSKILNLEKTLNVYLNEIDLMKLDKIKNYDLVINLNVLHHAGIFFDTKKFKQFDNWFLYIKEYLTIICKKSKYLFFQVGNMARGSALFDSDNTIEIMQKIFNECGWKILKVGVISNLDTLDYETYELENLDSIKLFKCMRNTKTNLVDYYYDKKLIKSLKTGFAQRPLWLCMSKH